jgi:hypothetical protein
MHELIGTEIGVEKDERRLTDVRVIPFYPGKREGAMNFRIVTAALSVCLFGGLLLVPKVAMAQGSDPFESLGRYPAWDLAVALAEDVQASRGLGRKAAPGLLRRFSDLKETRDALLGATAPICQEVRDHRTRVEEQRIDARNQQKAADDLQTAIDATPPKHRTKEWAKGMEAKRAAVNDWGDKVDKRGEELDREGEDLNRKIKAMLTEWTGRMNEFNRDAEVALGNGRPAGSPQERLRVLRGLKEPPAITREQVAISFFADPKDERSTRILRATDMVVAGLRISGTLAGQALATRAVLVAGKTLIAMEDAADVYLVKQDNTYETALTLLRGKEARKFSEIVGALRNNQPLKPGAPPEMVAVARAILDPKLGNSGARIAWSAMWSPEAKRAGLTKFVIEAGGDALGQQVGRITDGLLKTNSPAYMYAAESWQRAEKALETVAEPADRMAWQRISIEAGRVMEKCFTAPPSGYAMVLGKSVNIFSKDILKKVYGRQDRREAPSLSNKGDKP